ncbi:hypothetical protein [uncultured Xylophilus sp.]|uniref:hypothetical protein n=1 Tax=uncultured Xylophilus sp. TaxID=296832 RepID=UPI0025E70C90|nr:hypothetical protein [uncultured Xylophilus sp.]
MSNPNDHPIHLGHLFFTRVRVEAIGEHEPTDEPVDMKPQNSINVRQDLTDKCVYQAVMHSVCNLEGDAAMPYLIDVEAVAMLHASEDLSPEEAKRGITITAHSVLFGAIREAVMWLTSRQPYGPVMFGLSVLTPRTRPSSDGAGDPAATEPSQSAATVR